MWFVGLVVGGLFGAGIGDVLHWQEAWLFFAAIGAIGAIALKMKGAFGRAPGMADLERRIEALEREIRAIRAAQATPDASATPTPGLTETSAVEPSPSATRALGAVVEATAPAGGEPATAPAARQDTTSADELAGYATAAERARAREPLVMTTARSEPSWLWQKLFGGNILAKVGVVLLFFGIASGLKLAVDFGLFPASVRLLLATVAGIAMIGFGYTRASVPAHRMFGLALQGGGFAVLYLATYFALARYGFIDHTTAFVVFALLGAACLALAVHVEGEPLAILGVSGAFLAPLLASTGSGSHVVLFSFYAVLTVLVLAVNWIRRWRLLTLTAFVFTLVTGMTWASTRFAPAEFATTEGFLILFAVLFSSAPIVPALFRGPAAAEEHWADTLLLYGTPIAAAVCQSWLFDRAGYPDVALAWSAVGAGLYYSAFAALLYAKTGVGQTRTALAAIAVAFYTLAVPLAFGVQVTTAFWAIEGFVLAWYGLTRERRWVYASGLLLQLVAGGYFVFDWHDLRLLPVLNDTYAGALIITASGLASAWKTRTHGPRWLRPDLVQIFSGLPGGWALAWWLGANASEISRFAAHEHKIALYTTLLVATTWMLVAIGRVLPWAGTRYVALLLSAVGLLGAIFDGWSSQTGHPLHDSMMFALPAAFASFYLVLKQHERDRLQALLAESHVYALLLVALTLLREALWAADRLAPSVALWSFVAWPLIPALCVLAVIYADRLRAWPVLAYRAPYLLAGAPALLCVAIAAAVVANFGHDGGGATLRYIPFASFFDLAQMVVIFTAYIWAGTAGPLMPAAYARFLRLVPAGLGFLWLSAMAMRIAHHWGGVAFRANALIQSGIAQSMLSLLWTALALVLMIGATRRLRRSRWFVGFALLGVVGAKFVLIDVVNKGTVTWTLSLIGVGLLILAASYFSPAPPKAAGATS